MKKFMFLSICLSFVILTGCLTDQLVVFEKNLLTEKEMNAVLGDYSMVTCNKEMFKTLNSGLLTLEKKGTRYYFNFDSECIDTDGKKTKDTNSGYFLLSHIPDTEMLLFSAPKVDPIENFFAIMKPVKDKLYVWYVLPDQPVAKGNIKFEKDTFKAEELKTFLTKYADAYALANAAAFVFQKKSTDGVEL